MVPPCAIYFSCVSPALICSVIRSLITTVENWYNTNHRIQSNDKSLNSVGNALSMSLLLFLDDPHLESANII